MKKIILLLCLSSVLSFSNDPILQGADKIKNFLESRDDISGLERIQDELNFDSEVDSIFAISVLQKKSEEISGDHVCKIKTAIVIHKIEEGKKQAYVNMVDFFDNGECEDLN